MIIQEHIDSFSSLFKEILIIEIALGNEIVETSRGWPREESIVIILKKPFKKKYEFRNLEYKFVNAPHYWKEEYYDIINQHILACKF